MTTPPEPVAPGQLRASSGSPPAGAVTAPVNANSSVPTPTVTGASVVKISGSTMEEMLEAYIVARTGVRDWRAHPWTQGMGLGNLRRVVDRSAPLPPWRLVQSLLEQLSVPPTHWPDFRAAYERAKLYRAWSENARIAPGPDEPATYVINHSGGNLTLNTERDPYPYRRYRDFPDAEPVMDDVQGYSLKPDPFKVGSLDDLEEKVREYWKWAGRPSSRKIADRSKGVFSHATVAKLIYDKPGKPMLKMEYVIGIIRGCGGDQAEQQRWVTAWRIIDKAAGKGEMHTRRQLREVSDALLKTG
jgi:hypothetical protein